jgi:hypothetical protein
MPPPPTASSAPDVTTPPSVGEVLSVSAEHLRGIHGTPRNDCWRCGRDSDPGPAAAAASAAGPEAEPSGE